MVDLSSFGAHFPIILCTEGKKNPWNIPWRILIAITPFHPQVSAIIRVNIQAAEYDNQN